MSESPSIEPYRIAALDQQDATIDDLVRVITGGIAAEMHCTPGAATLAGEHVRTRLDRMPVDEVRCLAAVTIARLAEARLTLNRTEGKNL